MINQAGKTGWGASAYFVIHLHIKDLALLYAIRDFLGVGSVYLYKDGKSASFMVSKLKDLINVIIPQFKEYPLQSVKSVDFQLWVKCINILSNKEHLTQEGLNEIISIKSALNKGLSENLKLLFKGVKPLERLAYKVCDNPLNPYWVSGFSEGDSSFHASISSTTNQVRVIYSLGLNERDLPLILKIQEFFGGIGRISNYKNAVQYIVASIKSIDEILIPHFDSFELKGNKLHNYLIWREISCLVKSKAHLDQEGLQKIYNLKLKLNKK